MSRDIWVGRWLQVRGRAKLALAGIKADKALGTEGDADVLAGTLQETYGLAKEHASREVTRGIDAVANVAKRAVRALDA